MNVFSCTMMSSDGQTKLIIRRTLGHFYRALCLQFDLSITYTASMISKSYVMENNKLFPWNRFSINVETLKTFCLNRRQCDSQHEFTLTTKSYLDFPNMSTWRSVVPVRGIHLWQDECWARNNKNNLSGNA